MASRTTIRTAPVTGCRRERKMTQPLRLTDTTLRDGSHAIHYSYTIEQVHTIVKPLDEAGIPAIEASHGAGLAGPTIQQGFSPTPDFDFLPEALRTAKR